MNRAVIVGSLSAALIILLWPLGATACTIDEYQVTHIVISPESADANHCRNKIPSLMVISMLRVVDTYWAHRTTARERYSLLSKRYQGAVERIYNIKKPDEYLIPLSEQERVWRGYKINNINITASNNAEVSLQVGWEQEGYSGTMTYNMIFVLEEGRWSIAGIQL